VVVHSALPARLAAEVDTVLARAAIAHVAHGVGDPVAAGVAAARDPEAVAFVGPIRSRAVAETVGATAPAGLPLFAPISTWVGVTRSDEPGCDDPADHRGTVFRLVARDTEVAARIAHEVKKAGTRAHVVAGEHEYGMQLDRQLRLVGLPRTSDPADADLVVLCGLNGEPEIDRTRSLAPLAVIAFDGVQGADLGDGRDVQLALPFAPSAELSPDDLFSGLGHARHAAQLVVGAGASDRSSLLQALRSHGAFDEHGDPTEPDVWLWRRHADWRLTAERPLTSP